MRFLYKCRRCGKTYPNSMAGDNGHDGYFKALMMMTKAMHDTKPSDIAATGFHHNCDVGEMACGVSDLIGFEPENDPQP